MGRKQLSFKERSERLELLKSFCETNKRLPSLRSLNTTPEEHKLASFMITYSYLPSINKLKDLYSKKRSSFRENLLSLDEFIKTNHRLPKETKFDVHECRLSRFMHRNKSKEVVIKLIGELKLNSPIRLKDEEWVTEIQSFCNTHKRLPNSRYNKYEARLHAARMRLKNNNDIRIITEKYRSRVMHNYGESLAELKFFIDKMKRLPNTHTLGENSSKERRLSAFIHRYRNKEDIVNLVGKYKSYRSFEENVDCLSEFIKTYNKLPRFNCKDKNEFRLRVFMSRHKNDKSVKRLINNLNG